MDLKTILLLIVAITNLFLGILIYFHREQTSKLHATFILLTANVALWSLALIPYRLVGSYDLLQIYMRLLYTVPLFIPVLFFFFSIVLTGIRKSRLITLLKLASVFSAAALAILVSGTNIIVRDTIIPLAGERQVVFGPWYELYMAHYILFFSSGFFILLKGVFGTPDRQERHMFWYVFWGTFTASSFALLTNLILPWQGYFELNWWGNVMTIFFVGFLMYSILQYNLFKLKLVATEIFVFIIIISLLVEILFVRTTTELMIKTSVLVLVSVLSYLLMRSVYKQIEAREKIERLAQNLEKANVRLRLLDEQKSEFVSIASHQLRSPLTAIKGYASLLLEGSYGKMSAKIRDPIYKIFTSTQNLVNVVEDFLNVTRIEQGRMKYNFTPVDIQALTEKIIDELKPNMLGKKLTATLKIASGKGGKGYFAHADEGKIRQVILNVIDNAIKYTPKGGITVTLSKKHGGGTILLTIQDTGIGLAEEFKDEMFGKFNRGNNSNKFHANGSGIGLYLARQIVKGHRGRIWAESRGEGKGTTFSIELPAA